MGYRLKKSIIDRATAANVGIHYMDRATAKWHDRDNGPNDLPTFCGWYWSIMRGGKVVSEEISGPYPTRSAAIAKAYKELHLYAWRPDLRVIAGGRKA